MNLKKHIQKVKKSDLSNRQIQLKLMSDLISGSVIDHTRSDKSNQEKQSRSIQIKDSKSYLIFRFDMDLSHKQTFKTKDYRTEHDTYLALQFTSEGVTTTHKRCNTSCSYAQKKIRIIDLPCRLDLLPRDEFIFLPPRRKGHKNTISKVCD